MGIFSIFVLVLTIFCAVRFTTNYINDSVNVTTTTDTDTDTDKALLLMDIVLDEKDKVVIEDEEEDRPLVLQGLQMTCPHGCTYYHFGCGVLGAPQVCDVCLHGSLGDKTLCNTAAGYGSWGLWMFSGGWFCCK